MISAAFFYPVLGGLLADLEDIFWRLASALSADAEGARRVLAAYVGGSLVLGCQAQIEKFSVGPCFGGRPFSLLLPALQFCVICVVAIWLLASSWLC